MPALELILGMHTTVPMDGGFNGFVVNEFDPDLFNQQAYDSLFNFGISLGMVPDLGQIIG